MVLFAGVHMRMFLELLGCTRWTRLSDDHICLHCWTCSKNTLIFEIVSSLSVPFHDGMPRSGRPRSTVESNMSLQLSPYRSLSLRRSRGLSPCTALGPWQCEQY
jgi:hypothetical protein